MKTNELESREIGELIQEITEFEWELWIERFTDGSFDIFAHNHENLSDCHAGGETLVECLRLIVDNIRSQRGEPSLAEEAEALIYQQEQHAAAPPVLTGPDASCRCGSRAPLRVERKLKLEFPWDGSPGWKPYPQQFNPTPLPGEIGRCPDCGTWYQFQA